MVLTIEDINQLCKDPESLYFFNRQRQSVYSFEEWMEYVRATYFSHVEGSIENHESEQSGDVFTENHLAACLNVVCTLMAANYMHLIKAIKDQDQVIDSKSRMQLYENIVAQLANCIIYEDTVLNHEYENIVTRAYSGDFENTKPSAMFTQTQTYAKNFAQFALDISKMASSEKIGTSSAVYALSEELVDIIKQVYLTINRARKDNFASMNRDFSSRTHLFGIVNEFIHTCCIGEEATKAAYLFTVINTSVLGDDSLVADMNELSGQKAQHHHTVTAQTVSVNMESGVEGNTADIGVIVSSDAYGAIKAFDEINPSVEGVADLRKGLDQWQTEWNAEKQEYFDFSKRVHLCNLQATINAFSNELKRTHFSMAFHPENKQGLGFFADVGVDVSEAPYFTVTAKITSS